jgi:hypothetical protein
MTFTTTYSMTLSVAGPPAPLRLSSLVAKRSSMEHVFAGLEVDQIPDIGKVPLQVNGYDLDVVSACRFRTLPAPIGIHFFSPSLLSRFP